MTQTDNEPMLIGMVAGEPSGDILGAGLIRALKQRYPQARFSGIGGPLMIAEGFDSLVPMERLSVMGLVEVLGRLRELVGHRRRIRDHFLTHRPAVFIGIDSPDFTLWVEGQLHRKGVKTVHYVSPSVWAWRQGRIKHIARSVNLMLTLFPFEARFYQAHGVPVSFVGHPLADSVPDRVPSQPLREQFQLAPTRPTVAILPGSRAGEIQFLGQLFLITARRLARLVPTVQFIMPMVNEARMAQMQAMIDAEPEPLPIHLTLGGSRDAMAAADVVLLASGTATLEAMLMKKPMVVAYRITALTYWIVSRVVKVAHISIPNLLSEKTLVPELIQHQATPQNLAFEVMQKLQNRRLRESLQTQFDDLHRLLKRDASERAAQAIEALIEGHDLSTSPALTHA